MLPVKTILHPTDFSEPSRAAFRLACSMARDYGARVIVLHVIELPLAVAGEAMLVLPPPEERERLREELLQLQPTNPKVAVEHRMVDGEAAAEILRMARQTKSDVIVLGTHGRTGLARLLMGSVAEQVVRKATCPVVTIKSPVAEENRPEESETVSAGAAHG